MTIRTVVIDDETPSLARLASLLAATSDFEVVGRFSSAAQAARMLPKLNPDAAFVDIQMPHMDGFSVVDRLPAKDDTAVVFVTAHSNFAVHAFGVAAIDYLLKPFDDDRFLMSLDRVRRHRSRTLEGRQTVLRDGYPERIPVVTASCITVVEVDDIDWLEAAGNYVRLHCSEGNYLHRESLTSLMSRLDPRRFLRIHRSTGVNVRRIQTVQSSFGREHVVTLQQGTRLQTSAAYRDDLHRAIGLPEAGN
jgi:two-component system, LytTR family, response regulator